MLALAAAMEAEEGPRAAPTEASVLGLPQALRLLGEDEAGWLRAAGVVRRLGAREVVIWGDVVDAIRTLEPAVAPLRLVGDDRPAPDTGPAASEGAGFLTVAEAARELGVSEKTLRRRLEVSAHVEGGPVDVSPGVRRHWRFPRETLQDWWRGVCGGEVRPAKTVRRPRAVRSKGGVSGAVDWTAEARSYARASVTS